MPWTAKDARQKNSAIKTPQQAKLWAETANAILASELKKGTPQAKAEAIAIQTANAKVKSMRKKEGITPPDESERLQEYTANRGITLKVDREHGVIEGVKILGFQSRNGRQYTRAAAQNALQMYEGKAVNIDHVEGRDQRSYRDRIGKLSGVEVREDGIYGRLLVNQKHALAEQLFWDAEHAPENVGLSHDATGRTKQRDGKTVVESITAVRSVDLVAEPATTAGLFESVTSGNEEKSTMDELALKEATLEQLKQHRPDLLESLRANIAETDEVKAMKAENEELKTKLAEVEKREAEAKHHQTVANELKEAKLDKVPEAFMEVLLVEQDAAKRKALIDDRKQLVEAAHKAGKPKSEHAASSGGANDDGAFDWDHFSEAVQETALV